MTTDRPHQKAQEASWAFAELRRYAGTHFDPGVVEALESLLVTHGMRNEII